MSTFWRILTLVSRRWGGGGSLSWLRKCQKNLIMQSFSSVLYCTGILQDECYDEFYKVLGDPIKGANCGRYTFFGQDPPPGDEECFACCFAYEGQSQTACNLGPSMPFMSLPDPNNWDPATDKWYGHGDDAFTTQAPGSGSAELKACPLAMVISINMLILSAFNV